MSGHNDNKSVIKTLPLWDHQQKAVETIQNYLTAAKQGTLSGAALIHMPTGTGKSGVIAISSHLIEDVGCVLVLCPRIALRDQLAKEIAGRFFTKLGIEITLPKRVYNVIREYPTIKPHDYPLRYLDYP